jgi:pantothenate kinase
VGQSETAEPVDTTRAGLVKWLEESLVRGERVVLGITGPPGVGKSTLTEELTAALSVTPRVVGMDAFHLAHQHLEDAGLVERKGAHFTFDGWGFVSLLRRIRNQELDEVVFVARFDRSIEDSIAAAIPITLADRVVIVEGNYLLLDLPPWAEVRHLLSRCVYLDLDDETRLERLIRRHIEFGKTPEHARHHVAKSDELNTQLIAQTRHLADAVLRF